MKNLRPKVGVSVLGFCVLVGLDSGRSVPGIVCVVVREVVVVKVAVVFVLKVVVVVVRLASRTMKFSPPSKS